MNSRDFLLIGGIVVGMIAYKMVLKPFADKVIP